MGLFLIGSFSFAQTNSETQTITEDHNEKDLNKVINDYAKDSQKAIKDIESIEGNSGSTNDLSDKELNQNKKQLISPPNLKI